MSAVQRDHMGQFNKNFIVNETECHLLIHSEITKHSSDLHIQLCFLLRAKNSLISLLRVIFYDAVG